MKTISRFIWAPFSFSIFGCLPGYVSCFHSVDTLMGAAGWFGLNTTQAIERLSRAVGAVTQWKELAHRNHFAIAEDKQVAPGF